MSLEIYHTQKLARLEEILKEPLQEYFPELRQTVLKHLETWQGFNADEEAEADKVARLADSLVGIADAVSAGLKDLRTKKRWTIPSLSLVRPAWKTDFLKEGKGILGFLKNGSPERRYLVYAAFRREPEVYADLVVLFQMLKPKEDTGARGLEVHCRFEKRADEIRAVAQCIEVYRVFAGYVDIEVDGEKHTIGPGYDYDTVVVPPSSRHRVINTSKKTSQILIVMGGGSARGYKIEKDGKIVTGGNEGEGIGRGMRICPPGIQEQFKGIKHFRKSTHEQT
jgi:mannose-6-phosphate isomerase-like protein (cupin superfamily)